MFGEAHPYTHHARMMRGAALTLPGRAPAGEQDIRTARERLAVALGRESPLDFRACLQFAVNLGAQTRRREAAALVEEVLPAALAALGPEHEYVRALGALAATP